MKILLIAPAFYGYHTRVKQELERLHHTCDEYIYPHSKMYIFLSLVSILGGVVEKYKNWHFAHFIVKQNNNYDTIIVIKGSPISDENYMLLKNIFRNAKAVLYLWDDINLDQRELDVRKYFDFVYSYNPKDCKKYGFRFRPMFYDQSIKVSSCIKDIDLFYIASYRPNRFDFINRILDATKTFGIKSKVILKCNFFYFLRNLKNLTNCSFFSFRSIQYDDMVYLLNRSRISVELCRPGQESLSTRSFEALLTRTKVITTNETIKLYDFYEPNNILVVDEFNPSINKQWIELPYKEININVFEKYSLTNFCRDLVQHV